MSKCIKKITDWVEILNLFPANHFRFLNKHFNYLSGCIKTGTDLIKILELLNESDRQDFLERHFNDLSGCIKTGTDLVNILKLLPLRDRTEFFFTEHFEDLSKFIETNADLVDVLELLQYREDFLNNRFKGLSKCIKTGTDLLNILNLLSYKGGGRECFLNKNFEALSECIKKDKNLVEILGSLPFGSRIRFLNEHFTDLSEWIKKDNNLVEILIHSDKYGGGEKCLRFLNGHASDLSESIKQNFEAIETLLKDQDIKLIFRINYSNDDSNESFLALKNRLGSLGNELQENDNKTVFDSIENTLALVKKEKRSRLLNELGANFLKPYVFNDKNSCSKWERAYILDLIQPLSPKDRLKLLKPHVNNIIDRFSDLNINEILHLLINPNNDKNQNDDRYCVEFFQDYIKNHSNPQEAYKKLGYLRERYIILSDNKIIINALKKVLPSAMRDVLEIANMTVKFSNQAFGLLFKNPNKNNKCDMSESEDTTVKFVRQKSFLFFFKSDVVTIFSTTPKILIYEII